MLLVLVVVLLLHLWVPFLHGLIAEDGDTIQRRTRVLVILLLMGRI